MLIRSQDGKLLIPLSQGFLYANGFKIQFNCVTNDGDFYNIVGEYSTTKNALKVLDMIEKQYDNLNCFRNKPNDGYISNIFQMPQDNELQ